MKSKTIIGAAQIAIISSFGCAFGANVVMGPGIDFVNASANQFMSIGDLNVFNGVYPQLAVGESNIFNSESTGALIGWSNHLDVNAYASMIVGMSNSTNAPYSFLTGESNAIEQDPFGWNPGNAILGSYNSIENHTNSTVIGVSNELGADGAPALSGNGSLVAGIYNQVESYAAWVLGVSNEVSEDGTTAIGWNLINHYHSSVVVGTFNQEFPSALSSWSEDGPAFVVGNGWMTTSRSNAIETLKNGETTLINKAWDANEPLEEPVEAGMAEGRALVVDGHTVLNGKVIISEPQGDISMGIYE